MYDLGPHASAIFLNQNPESLRRFFAQTALATLFDVDEFLFEPFGYSVNGLRDAYYFTIHVTPQKECSYASFETNLEISVAKPLVEDILSAFSPQSFDVVIFHPNKKRPNFILNAPILESSIQELGDKYFVHFYHYGAF